MTNSNQTLRFPRSAREADDNRMQDHIAAYYNDGEEDEQ